MILHLTAVLIAVLAILVWLGSFAILSLLRLPALCRNRQALL